MTTRRAASLAELGRALLDEEHVREQAAARTAALAAEAVWLGASLADLASVTGRSRQAARKRWSGLGAIERRRRWLSHHLEEIGWALRLVREDAALQPADRARIADAERLLVAEFAADARDDDGPGARWRRLDRVMDVDLRAVLQRAAPAGPTAEFAVHGARGVLGYYDHATREARAPAGS